MNVDALLLPFVEITNGDKMYDYLIGLCVCNKNMIMVIVKHVSMSEKRRC